MIVGCFALVEPFTPMERQFQAIQEMGIKYADVIDLPPIVIALQAVGFDGATAHGIAGPENINGSYQRLRECSGE